MKIYALYKGEELLSTGTIYEIAKEMNVEVRTIRFYSTPTYKKRVLERKKGKFENQRSLILLEDCNKEE